MKKSAYPKYKDSGIEWLSQIPAHWQVMPFKYSIDRIESGKREYVEDSAEILSIGGEHIGADNKLKLKNLKYVSEEFYNKTKKGRVQKNDILIVKDGATIGKTAYVDESPIQKMLLNEHVYRVKGSKYIYYFILSSFFQSKIWAEDNSSAQEGLNLFTIKNIPVLYPSKKEQEVIADFLDKETSRIDSLIEKIKQSIALLKEYRLALITSAVTGQIDVREESQIQEISTSTQKAQKLAGSLKVLDSRFRGNDRRVGSNKVDASLISDRDFLAKRQRDSRVRGNDRQGGNDRLSRKDKNIFKKAVFGTKIVSQMQDDPHFGRTKFMKILYLSEAHLQIPLKGTYKREAAGPLDNSIYKMEWIMKKNKWFEVVKASYMSKYKPLKNFKEHKQYFDKYWGSYIKELNQLLVFVKKFTTEQLEIVDTIFAVWNDFLLEGKKPSDSEIIYEIKHHWHERKQRFPDKKLKNAINWMKENKLVPQGHGPKTSHKTKRKIK